MPAVFGRRRRWSAVSIAVLVTAAAVSVVPAKAETVTVSIDEARILQLPDQVATIVIGNPLIADASLQRGGVLVITGKGYGATNLLALDRGGRIVLDQTVRVLGPATAGLVTVYKGADRESYTCTPECEPRLTLGDQKQYFTDTLGQINARVGQAQGGAPAGGPTSQ